MKLRIFPMGPLHASFVALSITVACCSDRCLAETDVFVSGEGGYHSYRIPAIVTTSQGTLLAFCEGRKSGRGDAGNIDLLVRRSTDAGKTWSAPIVVWEDGDNTCGNPTPVVDQTTGTVWLAMTWNLGSDHERQIMEGTSKDVRHVYMTHSTDDGVSWQTPAKISDHVRKPHWRWYATGPGNGIQLTRGPHVGRLLIPANHSDHRGDGHPYHSHVFWSDDHGESWQLGGIEQDRTNESAVVELTDGTVLHAMRSYHGENKRAMATSQDGGTIWSDVYLDATLDTPVCQANILRYSWPDDDATGNRSRLLFSSPKGKDRSHMTVWLSFDEGRSWPVSEEVYAGSAAYSNLVVLPDHSIGLLYEKQGYKSISLATFSIESLEEDWNRRYVSAENALLYQRNSGGWPKNYDRRRAPNDQQRRKLLAERDKNDTMIDNGATHTEIRVLARAFQETADERFRDAAMRGIHYLLDGQYENGGWPQQFPEPRGYARHITFNDNAMIGVMMLLRDIARGAEEFTFVSETARQRCATAVDRGVDCILKCQISVDDTPTVWCAQHDHQTFAPEKARSYELVSLSGSESVGIVRFLMQIEQPSDEVVRAIESAVAWFERSKLEGIKVNRVRDATAPKGWDKVVIEDLSAPPLWARFYDIGTNRPMFCDRDGVPKASLAEIGVERRTGYSWLGDYAGDLLAKEFPKWKERLAK